MKQIFKKSTVIMLIFSLCFVMMTAFITTESYAAGKTHLRKTSIELQPMETYQQKLLTASGKKISSSRVKWSSNNSKIARISKTGKVTAVDAGTTTLKAKYKGKTYKFKVKVWYFTVDDFPNNMLGVENGIYVGDGFQIKVRDENDKLISPNKVSFSSSNNTVAKVDKNGYLTGLKKGYAKITMKYKGETWWDFVNVIDTNSSPVKPKGSVTCVTPLPCVCISNYGVVFRVDSLNAKLENRGRRIRLDLEGTCTANLKGDDKEGYPKVKFRVCNSAGNLVESGTFNAPRMRVGDRTRLTWFVDQYGEGNFIDDYTIEVYGEV